MIILLISKIQAKIVTLQTVRSFTDSDTGLKLYKAYMCSFPFQLACKQALLGTPAAGQKRKGELAVTFENLNSASSVPCGYPSTQLSDFGQSEWSINKQQINVNKYANSK